VRVLVCEVVKALVHKLGQSFGHERKVVERAVSASASVLV